MNDCNRKNQNRVHSDLGVFLLLYYKNKRQQKKRKKRIKRKRIKQYII
jgi:hypothetical protein